MQLKAWSQFADKLYEYLREPPTPPPFKEVKDNIVKLETLAAQIISLAEAYKNNMNTLLEASSKKSDVERVLNCFQQNNFENITGDDMFKLSRVIGDRSGYSCYADPDKLNGSLVAENARINETIAAITEGINFFTDRKLKSLVRGNSSLNKDPVPEGTALEAARKLHKEGNHAEAV
jgi:hypothetical protein